MGRSIELWARQRAFVNTWPGLLGKDQSATANGWLIWYESNGTVHFKRNGQEWTTPAGSISTDRYHHLAVTYDGSRLIWYVDGGAVSNHSASFPTNTGTAPVQLGRGDVYGNDDVDEVALYNTALPISRIAA